MILVWDSSFRRAFKRVIRKNPQLEQRTFEILAVLEADPFAQSLKAHKLRGQLEGLWACWVEYDCRIVYIIKQAPDSDQEMIILVDIGTHDEVY